MKIGNRNTVDAAYYFNRGKSMMDRKDYVEAVTSFQTVVESYSGSDLVDDAQFMLAEARFMSEDYILAAFEYERVYADYPTSNYAPEAQYKKAVCYSMESPIPSLDQENTLLAIDEFLRFLDNYPASTLYEDAQKRIAELTEKLAKKEFDIAEFYLKSKAYDSAKIYYESVIIEYARTTWALRARIGLAKVNWKLGEKDLARQYLLVLINGNVDSSIQRDASRLLEEYGDIENGE